MQHSVKWRSNMLMHGEILAKHVTALSCMFPFLYPVLYYYINIYSSYNLSVNTLKTKTKTNIITHGH